MTTAVSGTGMRHGDQGGGSTMAGGLMPLGPDARVFFALGAEEADFDAVETVNARLAARGKNAAWLPMRTATERFDGVVATLRLIHNVTGLTVCLPYRAAVIRHLDRISPRGRLVGAIDVVRRTEDGSWEGDSALHDAFRRTLRSEGVDARASRVWLIGARGGAAAALSLAERGAASITVVDDELGSAAELAARIRAAFPQIGASVGVPDARSIDIVVNGAAAGDAGSPLLAFQPGRLRPDAVVVDAVAGRRASPFVEQCARAGLATVGGDALLVHLINIYEEFFGFGRLPYKDASLRHPLGAAA